MSYFTLFDQCTDENFSTALLAFSMKSSQRFAQLVVRLILGIGTGQATALIIEKIEREYSILLEEGQRKRLDLVVRGRIDTKTFVAVVEAKLESGFSANQLTTYREWLDTQPERVKRLVILTRHRYNGQSLPHDSELQWTELLPLISQIQSQPQSDFEQSYWKQVRQHFEETMPTFEGFKDGACNVHSFMQCTDLFLDCVLKELGITKARSDWHDLCAAYYIEELSATIGFWWWRHQNFRNEPQPNQFCVWRNGDKQSMPLASLEEIVRSTDNPETRDQYIASLADRIRELCPVKTHAIAS